MATATKTAAKARTWRSYQFLDVDAKQKVVDLLNKSPFGADVSHQVDGSYILTNAPVRDFSFALKKEAGLTLPDATVLDGDPRTGAVTINAETPVETAASVAADADKEAEARQKAAEKAERDRLASEAKAVKDREKAAAKAAKAQEKAEAKAAKEKAKAEAKAQRAANSPKSKAAIRAEAGEATATVLDRHTRMYASTVEIQCGKCQAIKEVHARSWAGIGYTYCNNCNAKLPYIKSGDGMTEADRKARGFRRTLDGIGRLVEATSMLTDAERSAAAAFYEMIRHHVNAPAWKPGDGALDEPATTADAEVTDADLDPVENPGQPVTVEV